MDMNTHVTPAELKTLREGLGLTIGDLAVLAGVSERTARYWESGQQGRATAPPDVAQMVWEIDRQVTAAAIETRTMFLAQANETGEQPRQVVLLRYRENVHLWQFQPEMRPLPVATHGAMLTRCRLALQEIGVEARIIYMEPQAYYRWLGELVDTPATRAHWASLQMEG